MIQLPNEGRQSESCLGSVGNPQQACLGVSAGATAASVTASLTAGTAASTFGIGAVVSGGAIAGAAGSIASQAFGVATGIQDKFDWKGVALSALSSAVGAGLGSAMKVAEKAGKLARFSNAVQRGALGSVITQGVAVATGLQHKFDWTGVEVAAVASGFTSGVGTALDPTGAISGMSVQGITNSAVSGLAGATAGAAVRSLADGSGFGDNLIAVLPDVIGATIGNFVAGSVQAAIQEARTKGLILYELPPKRPQLNGAVERCNGAWRYEFYAVGACPRAGLRPDPGDLPRSVEALNPILDSFQHLYNHHRPHGALDGMTPARHLAKLQAKETQPSHME